MRLLCRPSLPSLGLKARAFHIQGVMALWKCILGLRSTQSDQLTHEQNSLLDHRGQQEQYCVCVHCQFEARHDHGPLAEFEVEREATAIPHKARTGQSEMLP